jgi:hypothetical protein
MRTENVRWALLADRHHGLMEGIGSLLATTFEMVVMVADESFVVGKRLLGHRSLWRSLISR